MTFLPIVDRELRLRARKKGTYGLRVGGAGLAALVTVFYLALAPAAINPGQVGGWVFNFLAWPVFVVCLFEGARQTADCLSSEKRAGTLGLLFLTDLKGYDIVLGKWIATGLNSLYTLLAILPLLGLPLLIGGVTGGEFWRLMLVLLHTLLLSLNTGMLVSACARSERGVLWQAAGLMLLLAVFPPLLRWVPWPGAALMGAVSPGTAFLVWRDAAYAANPQRYWQSIVGLHLLGWIFLSVASLVLPRAWQERPAGVRSSGPSRLSLAARSQVADFSRRQIRKQRWLEVNPVAWLAAPSERQQRGLWVLVSTAGGLAIVLWVAAGGSGLVLGTLVTLAFAVHVILTVWLAFQAAYSFAEARDSGAFELLLAAPMTESQILDGYVLGLKRQFLGPVVALLTTESLLILLQAGMVGGATFESFLGLGVAGLSMLLFITDLFAVGYLGLWFGLTAKRPSQAFAKTILLVLLAPLFCGFCGILLPVVWAVKNIVFINYGRDQLRRNFRRVITDRMSRY